MNNPGHRTHHIPEAYAARLHAARAKRTMKGERRVITILFVDVTGSTAMAEQLDPEEWAEIMNEAYQYLTAPVFRYEGVVVRLMGDAVLAFFGAPIAHEDDPQRAVLAGLDMIKEIRPFCDEILREYGLEFDIRVGINTGPVVVGEMGSDLVLEYTAMGDAVNLAARMEQTAEPGTVQISANTYKLVAPLFDSEPLGQIAVKGKSEPIPSYRVLAPRKQPGRVRGIEGLQAPLTGRREELAQLRQALAAARQKTGQIVFLLGEAGLGKSRLIEELRAIWAVESVGREPWVVSRGISYDAMRPYGLFQQQLGAFGVQLDDPAEVVLRKVDQGVSRLDAERQAALRQAVQVLLAVRPGGGAATLEGQAFQRELFSAIRIAWEQLSRLSPSVIVMDDLHWADQASVDLLIHLFSLVDELPILFLCAMRPHKESGGWKARQAALAGHATQYREILLRPLSGADSEALIDGLLAIDRLPRSVRRLILHKAEGNPFFVEEVIRTLIENGAIRREADGVYWNADFQDSDLFIPDSLHSLLVARIDRLDREVRNTLQLAAVIGRSFQNRVLAAISDTPATLAEHLQTLAQADLVEAEDQSPDLVYTFRHGLTRDAAYRSILRRQRRRFHRRVGQALETLFSERLDEESNRLAYHFREAGDYERAFQYYVKAGNMAARMYANIEAIDHFESALAVTERFTASAAQLIDVYHSLGRTLEVRGDHDAALARYQALEVIAGDRQDDHLRLAALLPQAKMRSTYTGKFEPELGRTLCLKALHLAQTLHDHQAEAQALWNLMLLEKFAGTNLAQAAAYGEQSLAIARKYGLTNEVAFALHDLASIYARLDRNAEARTAAVEAQALWRRLNNLPLLADSLTSFAWSQYILGIGSLEESIELAEEALRISRPIGNAWGQAHSLNTLGPLYIELGDFEQGILALAESILAAEDADFIEPQITSRLLLAWLYGFLGQPERGLVLAQAARDIAGEFAVRFYIQAMMAQLALSLGRRDEASRLIDEAYRGYQQSADMAESDPMQLGTYPILQRVRVHVALANQAYDDVLSWAVETTQAMAGEASHPMVVEILRLKGMALLAQGRLDEAEMTLEEVCRAAEHGTGERSMWRLIFVLSLRRTHWQSLYTLSQIARQRGDLDLARELGMQARAEIEWVLERIQPPVFKASFVEIASIKEIIENTDPVVN